MIVRFGVDEESEEDDWRRAIMLFWRKECLNFWTLVTTEEGRGREKNIYCEVACESFWIVSRETALTFSADSYIQLLLARPHGER